ncbi:hypothetical protein PACTADRAFT_50034 [Pachysolen tannophilus NRRL Y-2460]|uniref:Raptor N-terminal CASPase-like domain-containing protein n=1 Tax=Pachysolen tannophilus NRRL Y-2460 TaxID=669874 RepID=A0A1E4TU73_PACTA|nr:hypothetical protein PACTADRAFT_50034 [Pachysolen tannophilus NRRL Y-2460]
MISTINRQDDSTVSPLGVEGAPFEVRDGASKIARENNVETRSNEGAGAGTGVGTSSGGVGVGTASAASAVGVSGASGTSGSASHLLKPLNMEMRHGFEDEYSSQHYMSLLANNFFIYYDDKRHNTSGNPITPEEKAKNWKNYQPILDWKIMKDRQKTVSAAVVLCLNLGVDPPDVVKTHPCAITEGGINPNTFSDNKKCLQAIGDNIQKNLENMSMRTKYKQCLDPSVEDMKRFLNQLRRSSKDERILFYYNGHGVPQPTQSGEIWVFNRGYTQYIPISLYDLQTWLGAPCMYVYDCNSAGNIITNFKKFVQKRIDDDNNENHDISAPSPTSAYIDSIQLAACRSNEILPMNPELPADLFTCCLTSPIEISVKWFIMNSPLKKHGYYNSLYNENGQVVIPGKLTDRRTPLGELNWIFTAITDTIAWTSLSRPLFKRLFRQDLMVAALFRNFLLAKRIMPLAGCNPISDPPLPEINEHPMWESFDLAIDQILSQLLKNREQTGNPATSLQQLQFQQQQQQQQQLAEQNRNGSANNPSSVPTDPFIMNFQHSTFFEQHLTAFEIWLNYGSQKKEPPQQLPIVLQVLLSQVHRIRALTLLSRFLDLGPWAAYLALSIGIFPYVLKLLQSPAQELKPVLTFIWARILGVDYKNTQQELAKDKGYNYFLQILNMPMPTSTNNLAPNFPQALGEPHKAMCCFIISLFVRNNSTNKKLIFSTQNNLTVVKNLSSENPLLRQWCALAISQLWDQYLEGKWVAYKDGYLEKCASLLNDPIPEVRTSLILALTNFLPDSDEEENNTNGLGREELQQQEIKLAIAVLKLIGDGSPIVRREIICFFSKFVLKYISFFLVSAFGQLEEEIVLIDNPNLIDEVRRNSPSYGTIFSSVWKALLILAEDPHMEVRSYAEQVVDYVLISLNGSKLADIVNEMEIYLLQKNVTVMSGNNSNGIYDDNGSSHHNSVHHMNNSIGHGYTDLKKQKDANLHHSSLNIKRSTNGNITTIIPTPIDDSSIHNGKKRVISTSSTVSNNSITEKLRNTLSIEKLLRALNLIDENNENEITGHDSQLSLNNILKVSYKPVSVGYGVEPVATTPRFKPRNTSSKPELPLVSGFFDYSCEYFQEPQIGIQESEETGSEDYAKRLWRRNRNELIIAETQQQKGLAVTGNWNNNTGILDNKTQPKLLKFTQFGDYLLSSDDKDNITCFDWNANIQLCRFSNGNPFGTKITDLKFLNEDDSPLLLTGSSDGTIRLYKNFHSIKDLKMVSAWRGLTDLLLTSRSSGLISEWQQSRGSLLVTGDVKIIRLWDAPREMCIVDIPARSTSAITSITSDQVAGNIFTCGFVDGSIRVYDRRLSSRDSMVKLWRDTSKSRTNSPIKKIQLQRGGFRELCSGNSDGSLNLWDIRLDHPLLTFSDTRNLMAMEIHEHAPVIAAGSKNVNIYSTSGDLLTTVKSPFGYLTNRTSNYLSSLTLHPHRMMMATSYNQNSQISIYNCVETSAEAYY